MFRARNNTERYFKYYWMDRTYKDTINTNREIRLCLRYYFIYLKLKQTQVVDHHFGKGLYFWKSQNKYCHYKEKSRWNPFNVWWIINNLYYITLQNNSLIIRVILMYCCLLIPFFICFIINVFKMLLLLIEND